ncbi:MAG: hypothetical protein ACHP84_01440 [Caulobacterales bacterium]
MAIASLALICSACGSDTGRAYYEQGDASYDRLKAITDQCSQRGGELRLKDGGDPTRLADYACLGAKDRKGS